MKHTLFLAGLFSLPSLLTARAVISLPLNHYSEQAPAALLTNGEKRPVLFGVKAGANLINMNFNRGYPRPAVPVEASYRVGAVAGLTMRVPLGQKWALEQDYLFAQMRGANKNTDSQYSFAYLSLPLTIRYQVLPRLWVLAGPQFDLLIRAEQTVAGATTNTTHDTEERSILSTAGVAVQLTDHLSLTARYLRGFNHVGLGQRSNLEEFKYEGVQLTAGYEF
ncbi:porin family protein [Hymenobacter defluvii]|uniref:PorT family protein n=1 Tax=Hymenobacter defluvii TaxID=2054411 RepID=A0ABS3TCX9_9BACT|nr:porin family protein [Hymenobacter defluvii]MBO3271512.1 PorT family protein [Hymenobacter defluvii]